MTVSSEPHPEHREGYGSEQIREGAQVKRYPCRVSLMLKTGVPAGGGFESSWAQIS